jgi:hypothetical protein
VLTESVDVILEESVNESHKSHNGAAGSTRAMQLRDNLTRNASMRLEATSKKEEVVFTSQNLVGSTG